MDEKFVNSFSESIVNVLSTMARLEVSPGPSSTKKDEIAHGDVTGLIGMTGDQAKGTFAISFTEKVILEITKRMLKEDVSGIDGTVTDMVGELTNMTSGGAKKLLSERGYRFDMAIPSVITGKNHVIRHKSKAPITIIPFNTEVGDFFIEVCFEE
jgi:chemotaxis protein CheX